MSSSPKIYPPLPGCRSALELDAAYLQGLFLCVNGTSQQDVPKLVQAAHLVLSSQDSAGELTAAAPAHRHLELSSSPLHKCPKSACR